MLRNSLSLIGALWLCAACASDVDVGGPREEGVAGGGGEANTELPSQQPKTPREYADGEATCVSDADCCVVMDDCQNAAYVVGLSDKEATERAILASYDPDRCTACIAPYVQVSCQEGKCVGSDVDYMDAGDSGQQLSETHCGTVEGPHVSSSDHSVFGCGTL